MRNIFANRTIGVNLGSFRDICRDPIIDAAETPYQKPPTGKPGFFLDLRFYKDAVPTELKRALKSARFPRRIRFGCDADRIWRVRRKTEPTGPGSETVFVSKIDTYGAVRKPHRVWSFSTQIPSLRDSRGFEVLQVVAAYAVRFNV